MAKRLQFLRVSLSSFSRRGGSLFCLMALSLATPMRTAWTQEPSPPNKAELTKQVESLSNLNDQHEKTLTSLWSQLETFKKLFYDSMTKYEQDQSTYSNSIKTLEKQLSDLRQRLDAASQSQAISEKNYNDLKTASDKLLADAKAQIVKKEQERDKAIREGQLGWNLFWTTLVVAVIEAVKIFFFK